MRSERVAGGGLTFLLLASIGESLLLGLAGCFLLRHDVVFDGHTRQ